MRKVLIAAILAVFCAAPAAAELPVGAKAPAFTTRAALGGEAMAFSLRAALARGPVILYFYPKAFTRGARSKRASLPRRPKLSPPPAPR